MAWYKTGGGGGNISEVLRVPESWLFSNGYTYKIETTSTSSSLAKIQVTEYFNDVQTESVEIKHNDSSTFTYFNDIYVSYNSSSYNWNVSANIGKSFSYSGTIYKEGDSPLSWGYGTTVNYSITGVSENKRELDSNKFYLITNENEELIKYYYFGNNRITKYKTAEQLEDYEFWYENLFFANSVEADTSFKDPTIYTGVKILSADNISRDFQIEFNIAAGTYGSGSENVLVGSVGTDSAYRFEIYTKKTYPDNLYLYGIFGNDTDLGNIKNKDVIVRKEGDARTGAAITTIVDGVTINTQTKIWTVSESDDYAIDIGSFRKYHTFNGTVNYIGFKWLS